MYQDIDGVIGHNKTYSYKKNTDTPKLPTCQSSHVLPRKPLLIIIIIIRTRILGRTKQNKTKNNLPQKRKEGKKGE